MVKGVSQRVVVVRPDENGMFEQAIFLVRDYSVPRSDAVREACRIANSYLMGRRTTRRRRNATAWKLGLAFIAGVLASSAVWTVVSVVL